MPSLVPRSVWPCIVTVPLNHSRARPPSHPAATKAFGKPDRALRAVLLPKLRCDQENTRMCKAFEDLAKACRNLWEDRNGSGYFYVTPQVSSTGSTSATQKPTSSSNLRSVMSIRKGLPVSKLDRPQFQDGLRCQHHQNSLQDSTAARRAYPGLRPKLSEFPKLLGDPRSSATRMSTGPAILRTAFNNVRSAQEMVPVISGFSISAATILGCSSCSIILPGARRSIGPSTTAS